jgi:hypothetical protein
MFEKGQSGNPGGRPKVRAWRDALERAVNAKDKKTKRPRLDLIAEACVESAMGGDPSAYKEIGDRLDGKVPQQQIHTGDEEGGAIQHKVTRVEIVAAIGNSKN